MRANLSEAVVVREWNVESFHQRVLELEAQGYAAQLNTYDVKPEMNPDTGEVIHLHTIEMWKPGPSRK